MVNQLTGKIWSIDNEEPNIDLRHIFVKSVRWVAGATSAAGEHISIDDPQTNAILWETTASGANYVEEVLLETTWPNGFEVSDIDNGILYITMR